jgi:hypothetical protein
MGRAHGSAGSPLWAVGRLAGSAVMGAMSRRKARSIRLACAAAAALAVLSLAVAPARAGDVVGTVRFTGKPASMPPLATTKDRAICGGEVEDESLLVSDGRLANVVVMLKGASAAPPAKLTLDQQGCRYRPHVQAGAPGSTLEIVNSDPLLHSVHGWAGHVTRFDVVTPSKGMRIPARLDRPEVIQIRCDVHSWMTAYVVVTEGPVVVAGRDGEFALREVPAGTYTLTAWHERLGELTVEVRVPARGEVRLDLAFGG